MIVRNKGSIRELIKKSPYSTYPCTKAEYVYMHGGIALPFHSKELFKIKICYSFGKYVDGGPIPLYHKTPTREEWIDFINNITENFDLTIVTLRRWCKPQAFFLHYLLSLRDKLCVGVSEMYPRIIRVDKYRSFDDYWRSISKKARNRYRYFNRNKGSVAVADPRDKALDILRINYSSPIRQNRVLPKGYRIPMLIAKIIKNWKEEIREGLAKFYIAVLDGKAVGYALITMLNGHAYFSRFLIHAGYSKYGVGNGLLIEVVRDLIENERVRIIQYGYWRNVNPGINHFLKQHGFSRDVEYVVTISGSRILALAGKLYNKYVHLSNVIAPNPRLTYMYSLLLDKLS